MKIKITDADCRACGACCVASGDGGDVLEYDLTATDVTRMTPHIRRQLLETFIGGETRHSTQAKRLASGGACCQYLRGTPGQRCSCSIYETRPEVCQKFRVGGETCRAARLELSHRSQET